ncbi:uncharacterized protein LOC132698042 [Cylas formicarius]|uniref:uncharacterized protein LOC132698042 n=1 Tax=Cylas formicarius TaxID=197179 RepID=UPI0029587861|nr:uncharacterized protein LOC132698042 [Cylas formicarius]
MVALDILVKTNFSSSVTSTIVPYTVTESSFRVTDLEPINNMEAAEYVRKQMYSFFTSSIMAYPQSDFIGRCFGVAKKIKQLLPILMLLLGVIVTKLGFLTLFSLKTIGLLLLLLFMNVAGASAKIATIFSKHGEQKSPQNIHFHVNPGKSHHDEYESYLREWDDKSDRGPHYWKKSDLYNLYNKLREQDFKGANNFK